jgi:hypothetical protein
MWPFKKKPKLKAVTADDGEIAYAKRVVDAVFYPLLKKNLDILNKHLAKKNLRCGITIQWFFDKVVEDIPDQK